MDLSNLLKDSPFHRQVWYVWNPATLMYTFYVPGEFRTLHPVGVFSPLTDEALTFDPNVVCEAIAEAISTANPDEEYDIEC